MPVGFFWERSVTHARIKAWAVLFAFEETIRGRKWFQVTSLDKAQPSRAVSGQMAPQQSSSSVPETRLHSYSELCQMNGRTMQGNVAVSYHVRECLNLNKRSMSMLSTVTSVTFIDLHSYSPFLTSSVFLWHLFCPTGKVVSLFFLPPTSFPFAVFLLTVEPRAVPLVWLGLATLSSACMGAGSAALVRAVHSAAPAQKCHSCTVTWIAKRS